MRNMKEPGIALSNAAVSDRFADAYDGWSINFIVGPVLGQGVPLADRRTRRRVPRRPRRSGNIGINLGGQAVGDRVSIYRTRSLVSS